VAPPVRPLQIWLCAALLCAGCNTSSPFHRTAAKPPALTKPPVSEAPAFQPQSGRSLQRRPQQLAKQDAEKSSGFYSRLTSPFRMVSGAFAGSPKNEVNAGPQLPPESDPTRLSSKPKEMTPELYIHAAKLLERQGRGPDAERQYEKALQIDPASLKAIVGLARLYHRSQRVDDAERAYEDAVRRHPTASVVYNDYGLFKAHRRQVGEAAKLLHQAVRLSPESKLYRNNLATVLIEAGRSEEAYAQMRNVHGEAVAHYNVGYLLHQGGHTRAAQVHFRRALAANPNLTAARQMLGETRPASY